MTVKSGSHLRGETEIIFYHLGREPGVALSRQGISEEDLIEQVEADRKAVYGQQCGALLLRHFPRRGVQKYILPLPGAFHPER